jgi:phosphinothricin acetyltransferase
MSICHSIFRELAGTASPPSILIIRSALYKDLPESLDIYNYYVVNTVVNSWTDPQPLSYIVEAYHSVLKNGLTYLVATVSDNEGNKKILGYTYANTLRPGDAYGAAVELTIYVAPYAIGKGYRLKLLTTLVEA